MFVELEDTQSVAPEERYVCTLRRTLTASKHPLNDTPTGGPTWVTLTLK
jgi:hypothetical protein